MTVRTKHASSSSSSRFSTPLVLTATNVTPSEIPTRTRNAGFAPRCHFEASACGIRFRGPHLVPLPYGAGGKESKESIGHD